MTRDVTTTPGWRSMKTARLFDSNCQNLFRKRGFHFRAAVTHNCQQAALDALLLQSCRTKTTKWWLTFSHGRHSNRRQLENEASSFCLCENKLKLLSFNTAAESLCVGVCVCARVCSTDNQWSGELIILNSACQQVDRL